MADKTKIEWADATWNVVNGCSVTSPGCKHCYAMKQAHRVECRRGLTEKTAGGMVWTGEVRFNEKVLDQPLRWKKPRRIFVCAHGDLFHESVPYAWIDAVHVVMRNCPQHQFQVLTKRSARMREYYAELPKRQRDLACHSGLDFLDLPLPNVWLGVSAENQHWLMQRATDLVETPAALRWLSCEPLLDALDVEPFVKPVRDLSNGWLNNYPYQYPKHRIDWIIVGGESGPKARPMHPDWARSLRDQCEAAGVPFLFKQWGEWLPCEVDNADDGSGTVCYPDDGSERDDVIPEGARRAITSLERQDFWRVGKKRAGRLLDGVQHDGFPHA